MEDIGNVAGGTGVPCAEDGELPFGRLRGMIEILGDIVSPMPAEWFEDEDPLVETAET